MLGGWVNPPRASSTDSTRSTHLTLTQRHRWKETDGKVYFLRQVPSDLVKLGSVPPADEKDIESSNPLCFIGLFWSLFVYDRCLACSYSCFSSCCRCLANWSNSRSRRLAARRTSSRSTLCLINLFWSVFVLIFVCVWLPLFVVTFISLFVCRCLATLSNSASFRRAVRRTSSRRALTLTPSRGRPN